MLTATSRTFCKATIKKFYSTLYVENDIKKFKALLDYLMASDYGLNWHVAPLGLLDNYLFRQPRQSLEPKRHCVTDGAGSAART
jgi:hypothetical protein